MGKYYFRHGRMEKIRNDNFGFRCANPQSSKLMCEALTYEDQYFKDMTMKHRSIEEPYTNFDNPPSISIVDWKIVEKKLRKREGYCNAHNLEIVLKQGVPSKERKLTLLHEMIHAYEAELKWANQLNIRELVFIFLYKNLMKRLGDKKANSLLKTVSQSIFWTSRHSILFILKSLDLDIRLKLPFGSVVAYGRTDFFSENKDKVK